MGQNPNNIGVTHEQRNHVEELCIEVCDMMWRIVKWFVAFGMNLLNRNVHTQTRRTQKDTDRSRQA